MIYLKNLSILQLGLPFFEGTIVFSIHQPRFSTFKLFDTVLFLVKGVTVYRGPADGVVAYFATQGYQCEMYDNPADFALDTLIDASRKPGELERLNQAYRATPMHENVLSIADKQSYGEDLERIRRQVGGVAARSMGVEIYYVAQRTLRNSFRSPQLFIAQIMISLVLGLLVGVVFFDLKKTTDPGVQDRFGTLFFMIMVQIMSTLSALEPLLKDRVLFIHVSPSDCSTWINCVFCRRISVATIGFSPILLQSLSVIFSRCELFHPSSSPYSATL